MQLRNIQQKTVEHVEVYYEHLLKLANCQQVTAINVLFTTFFKVGLFLPKISNCRYEEKYFNRTQRSCYSL
jgi:hypothetical protein